MPNTTVARWLDIWYPSFQRLAVTLFILLTLLIIVLVRPAQGDDLTGLPQNDPKDLSIAQPPPSAPCSTMGMMFQPLPMWSRYSEMPSLPEVLKPMGKKTIVPTPPAPASLAPPKDEPVAAEKSPTPPPVPPPAPAPSPALIAVSPFLQWIQANPQAAAAQARQQAGAYQGNPTDTAPTPNGAPAPATAGASTGPVQPYWLPPLIDSAPFGVQNGSSAAIYTTPQR